MGDKELGEGLGSMGLKIGSCMGKGASSLGKKVAQSEAGRSAGKAAVKGAAEGVQQDLTARYGFSTTTTISDGSKPAPTSTPTATPTATPSEPRPTSTSWDDDGYPKPRPRTSGPPKPSSLLNRLNFLKESKKKTPRKVVRRQVDPKERVYKLCLSRQPDWDRLPMARALFHFKGEMKCDLEFRKGQIIQIITRTETQDDWWEGKLEDRIGIFPANYVKLM